MWLPNVTPWRNLLVIAFCITGIDSAPPFESERWENETEASKEYAFQNLNKLNPSESGDLAIGNPLNSEPVEKESFVRLSAKQKSKSSLSYPTTDDYQLKENKSNSIRSSGENPVFFTKAQKDNKIHFEKDTFNPNNILQATQEELSNKIKNSLEQKAEQLSPDSSELTASSFFSTSPYSNVSSDLHPQDAIRTMDLTLNIVRASNWDEENIVFSPLSICNVLALLMMGAQGETFNEISQVLKMRETSELSNIEHSGRFHEAFRRLLSLLHVKSGQNVSLEIANEIFTDKLFTPKDAYVSDALKYYQSPVESFDFGRDGKQFRDQVNEWVKRKTNGKIRSIVDEPPSPSTKLVFVNAVYFKGSWEVPFIERITRKKEFFVKSNETIEVKMMANILTIPYLEQDDYQMVGIPYKGNQTGFFVIIPKSSDGIEGLKALEKKLSAKDLLEKLGTMQQQKVALKIPKMKISTDGHMKEILSNLGIPSMFDPNRANFSKISSIDGIYVSAVHHRAMLELNEKGTEAAAVTIGTGDRTIDELPIPFVANKPFIFFIYHVTAKTVLFWGRVTRPEST